MNTHPTPYVASLRVYEPIEIFEPKDKISWAQKSIIAGTNWDEQFGSLSRVITSQPPSLEPAEAYFLDYGGERYVAPWATATRCWAALEEFKSTLPPSIVKFFIPKTIEDLINSNTSIFEGKVSHILTSTWSIPPRWFALFTPNERSRGVNEHNLFTILRTSIVNAITRCSLTHQVVLSVFGRGEVEREVQELLEWLEIFDGKSIVELDYGGLATYLNKQLIENGETGLDADTSVEDINFSIECLASGNGELASRGYEKLVSRWKRVSALESAS